MATQGDLSLAEQVLVNRRTQEQLAEGSPEHPARAFGGLVEATSSSSLAPVQQDLVQKTCEAVIQAAIVPAITRMFDVFSQQFQAALNSQARAQEEVLTQMLQAAQRVGTGRPLVTINTSSRRDEDFRTPRVIDTRTPIAPLGLGAHQHRRPGQRRRGGPIAR